MSRKKFLGVDSDICVDIDSIIAVEPTEREDEWKTKIYLDGGVEILSRQESNSLVKFLCNLAI